MSNNQWIRTISFNKTNEKDKERLKLIGKKSFSRFIKKLLDEEIERRKNDNCSETNNTPQPKKVIPKISGPVKPTIINPMLQQRR